MRIFLFFVLAGFLNTLDVQISNAQTAVSITSVTKKSYNGSDVSCYGVKDAELTVNAQGGNGVLKYSINDGAYQQSNVFSNLAAGHYYFKVKDVNNNVSNRVDIDVSTPNSLRITSLFNTGGNYGGNASCYGASDGSFGITTDGGTGHVLASKDNGASYQSAFYFDKLAVRPYMVKIEDVNGCTATGNYTVKGPDPVNATFNQTDFSCSTSKGNVVITPSGGAGSGYSYNVDNGPTTWSTTLQNLSGGTHQIKITDYRGCTSTVPVTLTKNYTAVASGVSATCTGSSATFNLNISTGIGNSFSGIYKDNTGKAYTANNLTTGNNIITTDPLTGSQTFSLVSVTSQTGCTATISGTATVTTTDPGTWGGNSNSWNDGSNWSCGAIPTLQTNVTIPATGHNPEITSGIASVKNLTIASGASLTVTGTLQIAGTLTNNGTLDVTNGTLEFIGTAAQTVSGSSFLNKTVNNLKISNNKGVNLSSTPNDTLNITGLLSFGASNCTFNTNNNLTLKSNAAGTAGVADITNNGANKGNSIIGNVTVERYINIGNLPGQHNKTWVMLATPTQGKSIYQTWMENGDKTVKGYGAQITGNGTGFDSYSGAPALKYYNDATNSWVGITNTNQPVYDSIGYLLFVRGDRSTSYPHISNTTLRTAGTLLTGTTNPVNVIAGKFQSVGNPYASAVDLRKISATGINSDVIVWDPTLTIGNPYGVGAYQTLYKDGDNYRNLLASTTFGPAGTINNNIESGAAFFVQSFDTDGQVYFTENSKASGVGKGIAMRTQTASDDNAHLSASLLVVNTDGSSYVADGGLQQFSAKYSNAIDVMDTRKIANSSENISIISNGKSLVIERRNMLTSSDTIYYNLTGEAHKNYRFIFNASGLETAALNGFIEDSYTKTETPLNSVGDTQLDFTVTSDAASKAANRFHVVFRNMEAMPVTFTSVNATAKNNQIEVDWKVENQSNMKEYDVERSADGNTFTQVTAIDANNNSASSYNWLDEKPVQGNNYYRIRSVDLNGRTAYTSIVKAQINNISVSINVYPNPAKEAKINIQFNNNPEGIYYARLVDPLGQVMVSKKIVRAAGSSTETIEWNQGAARGVYGLEITQPDGSMKVVKVVY